MDRNGAEEPRNRREHRNSSGQIVIDPDENLSDKEIYPPSRVNIPSIGNIEFFSISFTFTSTAQYEPLFFFSLIRFLMPYLPHKYIFLLLYAK